MKNLIRKNKLFFICVLLIIGSSIFYKLYKVRDAKNNVITKEVVTIYLKNNEIKDGIVDKIDEYNKSHEDIYIRLRLTNDDFDNIVHTKLANEYDIDIFEYNGKTLIEKNFIKPLNSINIDLSNIKDNSFLYYNDDIMGVKYGSSMEKLMYNEDLLKNLKIKRDPDMKTLDSLIKLLEEIKSKDQSITPMQLSLNNIHDLFSILGTMASSENTTYPTFWNYKTGEYDYDGLKEVLSKLNYMYEKDLINKDLDVKTQESLFNDFKDGKTAIIPANFSQKHSVRDRLEGINLSFSNIPFNSEDGNLYYYTYSRTLVLANNDRTDTNKSKEEVLVTDKHNKAVKEVYEWLISDEVTSYLMENDYNFASFNNKNDGINNIDKEKTMYDAMNDDTGYIHNYKDPTEVLANNSVIVRETIYKMIKGEIDINTGVEKLNEDINKFITNNTRNKDVDLDKYKE